MQYIATCTFDFQKFLKYIRIRDMLVENRDRFLPDDKIKSAIFSATL